MHVYAFVDGGYLRKFADDGGYPYPNVYKLANNSMWSAFNNVPTLQRHQYELTVNYYDASPADSAEINPYLRNYWDALELLRDTQLRFGTHRGKRKRDRGQQKGVDTLLATEMLVGSFNKIFPWVILISGDSDFVPVIDEVQRTGVRVVVAAWEDRVADELKRIADRFVALNSKPKSCDFPPLIEKDNSFPPDRARLP